MNRDEAYRAMLNGEKLTHIYALPGEYIYFKNGVIVDNQGMNIHAMFSILISWLAVSRFIKVARNEIHNRMERK